MAEQTTASPGDLGRAAYEAESEWLAEIMPGGRSPSWDDLDPEHRAVYQRIAAAVRDRMAAEQPRPGDQPLPVPNDGPSMHDLVADDVRRCHPGGRAPEISGVVADLAARKALGLDRYASLLQANNGRDALRDLYEEQLDSLVYCRQWLAENENADGSHGPHGKTMWSVYRGLLTYTLAVGAVMDARGEVAHRG